jgi:hypothetical protein
MGCSWCPSEASMARSPDNEGAPHTETVMPTYAFERSEGVEGFLAANSLGTDTLTALAEARGAGLVDAFTHLPELSTDERVLVEFPDARRLSHEDRARFAACLSRRGVAMAAPEG